MYRCIVCTESGMLIPFEHARIINFDDLTEGQIQEFEYCSDSELIDFALEVGKPVSEF
jgi:hypothetical protein